VRNAVTIPDGIQTDSERIPLDSALKEGKGRQGREEPTSSGTESQTRGQTNQQPEVVRLNGIDRWDALAVVVAAMRPDWRVTDVLRAITRDDRPPRDVIAAAIAAAADRDARHPGAIAHRSTGTTTPTPPPMRGEVCTTHLGELAATCRGCAADRKAAPTPESAPLAAERGAPVAVVHPDVPNA
jgi:hypothetical protein